MSDVSSNKKIENVSGIKLETATRRAKIKLTGLLATNHLPFLIMDTLTPLCGDLFPDSKIAQQLSVRQMLITNVNDQIFG